jgi:PAS domain S-box-containing protein
MAFEKECSVPERIHVVGNEPAVLERLGILLNEIGCEATSRVVDFSQAVDAAEESRPDLVILCESVEGEHDSPYAEFPIGGDAETPVLRLKRRGPELFLEGTGPSGSPDHSGTALSAPELRAAMEIALYKHVMEKRLREEEELHRAAFSGLSEAVLITTEDGAFTYVSPNAPLIFGYSLEEIRNLGTVEMLLGRDLYDPELLERQGEIRDIGLEITDGAGREHNLSVMVRRVSVEGGNVLYSCRATAADANEHDSAIAQRDLSIALSNTSNLTDALTLSLDTALRVSGLDKAAIHLVDDDLKMEATAERVPLALESSDAADGDVTARKAPRPATVIPVRYKGNVVASMHFESYARTEIPRRTLTALETIAAQVGSALARIRAERTLKAARTGVILDAVGEMIAYQDRDGKILWANRAVGESVGRDPSRVEGRYCYEILQRRSSRCPGCPVVKTFETGDSHRGEIATLDGRVWSIRSYPIKDETANVIGVVKLCRDVTDRKKTERALEESERRYHALFEDSPVSLWEEDFSLVKEYVDELKAQGIENLKEYFDDHPEVVMQASSMVRIRDVNEATVRMYKAKSKQHVKDGLDEVLCPEATAAFGEELVAVAEGKREFETETMNRTLDGDVRHVFLKWSVAPGFEESYGKVLVSLMDITERKRAEDQVRASLEEKEVLLGEIHHRVKNNLAFMSSLLNLQARHVREEGRRRMFEDARTRIHSMAVAHELLYRAENLADLDIPEYVAGLADHLVISQRRMGTPITLRKDIEPVSFGLDTAIPLGLILTELVTNSIKHAFPHGVKGEIRISLRALDHDRFELSVKDTGSGLPPRVDPNNPQSLGLNLVKTFVGQLNGALEVRTDEGGTETLVRFADTSRNEQKDPACSQV